MLLHNVQHDSIFKFKCIFNLFIYEYIGKCLEEYTVRNLEKREGFS